MYFFFLTLSLYFVKKIKYNYKLILKFIANNKYKQIKQRQQKILGLLSSRFFSISKSLNH